MNPRFVVILACAGLLAVGATMLSGSPAGRNIFHAATEPNACSQPCPDEKSEPAPNPSKSSSAGFTIVSNSSSEFDTEFDAEMSGVCQGACATRQQFEASEIVAQPGAEDGDLARCPVSGVVFEVASQRPRIAVEQDVYRLCCDGCAKKFRAEPARFVTL